MPPRISVSHLIRCHASWSNFDYQVAIDWALDLIRGGTETESVLILASLSRNEGYYELAKYVSATLRELGLDEYSSEDATTVRIQFHVEQMLYGIEVRKHLLEVCDLCYLLEYREDLMPFYLLRYSWDDLDECGTEFYYGTSKGLIGEDIKRESGTWLQNHAIVG